MTRAIACASILPRCRFGLGRERRRHVCPSPALCLIFDLRRDRGGITVGVADHLRDEVVLHRRPQQVLGVEIEGAPLKRQLRRALEKLARRIREELRDVDLLDCPARGVARRFACR